MKVSNIFKDGFVLNGECPHCQSKAAFMTVGEPFQEGTPNTLPIRMIGAARCVACNKYILAIVRSDVTTSSQIYHICDEYYPLGAPNQDLEKSIPEDVAEDFREAIRCQWVKAYRACVVMCRRAIQSSVITLNAKGKNLVEQIDDLASKGTITQPLREFAHEIRLAGNVGAHADGLDDTKDSDAEDIVAFTREYLDHVYVMPAKLKARRPPKP
ncbi:MAG: DUF4145 domain-containing protein [Acidobacteriia bacterium]|nr:DUF4145 domain-containing protein [Terriglobia bacterium]